MVRINHTSSKDKISVYEIHFFRERTQKLSQWVANKNAILRVICHCTCWSTYHWAELHIAFPCYWLFQLLVFVLTYTTVAFLKLYGSVFSGIMYMVKSHFFRSCTNPCKILLQNSDNTNIYMYNLTQCTNIQVNFYRRRQRNERKEELVLTIKGFVDRWFQTSLKIEPLRPVTRVFQAVCKKLQAFESENKMACSSETF